MTSKDFELIAAALLAAKPDGKAAQKGYISWVQCVTNIADALATTNPRFDRARFLQAATGVGGES
jgi:hypothetical protein